MSKKKKNFNPHKGNKVNQGDGKFPFVDEFNTWSGYCNFGELRTKQQTRTY